MFDILVHDLRFLSVMPFGVSFLIVQRYIPFLIMQYLIKVLTKNIFARPLM